MVKWLGRIIFLLCALPLVYLLFLSFFRPETATFLPRLEPFKMTDAQRKICENITDDQLVRAAVRVLIELAAKEKESGVAPGDAIFQFTYEDFRASNPDCCRIRNRRSGEEPLELAPFFNGTLEPKVYGVDFSWRTKGIKTSRSSLVACYGDAVSEDLLRSYLYRSERPINWADILM